MLKYLPIFDIVQLYIHILHIHNVCVMTYLYVFNKYCFLTDQCFTFVTDFAQSCSTYCIIWVFISIRIAMVSVHTEIVESFCWCEYFNYSVNQPFIFYQHRKAKTKRVVIKSQFQNKNYTV